MKNIIKFLLHLFCSTFSPSNKKKKKGYCLELCFCSPLKWISEHFLLWANMLNGQHASTDCRRTPECLFYSPCTLSLSPGTDTTEMEGTGRTVWDESRSFSGQNRGAETPQTALTASCLTPAVHRGSEWRCLKTEAAPPPQDRLKLNYRHHHTINTRCDRPPLPSRILGHSYFSLHEWEENNNK